MCGISKIDLNGTFFRFTIRLSSESLRSIDCERLLAGEARPASRIPDAENAVVDRVKVSSPPAKEANKSGPG